jgi:alpha-L-fucosidase
VFDWPTDGKLVLPGLRNMVQDAYLLATHGRLNTSANPQGVIVSVPNAAPDKISSTIVLKFKRTPEIN